MGVAADQDHAGHQRCDDRGGNFHAIEGAHGTFFLLSLADTGIRVVVADLACGKDLRRQ
jgi:hypothetical protein